MSVNDTRLNDASLYLHDSVEQSVDRFITGCFSHEHGAQVANVFGADIARGVFANDVRDLEELQWQRHLPVGRERAQDTG